MINIDMSLNPDTNIVRDKFDLILQEIGILFDTDPGEVLGDHKFGSNFEKYIWDTKIGNNRISSYVLGLIKSNTLTGSQFDIKVDTEIAMGTEHDIILVHIRITDPATNETTQATYNL